MNILQNVLENLGEIAMLIAAIFLGKNKKWKEKIKALRNLNKDIAKEEKKAAKQVEKLQKTNERIETLKEEKTNVGS